MSQAGGTRRRWPCGYSWASMSTAAPAEWYDQLLDPAMRRTL